jgi:hypothetical protein
LADSASLVVACWGEQYKPYIARWWESVKTLNRKPDEIVLATIKGDPAGLFYSVPGWVKTPIIRVVIDSDQHNVIWQKAARASTKDWIVTMPIDDQYHPQALDFLNNPDGDLLIDNCEFLQGGSWIPTWDLSDTHNRRFAPAVISPFRRNLLDLFEQVPADCYWGDFVFYLLAVKAGVKVIKTDNYRIIHDLGFDHETMSGQNSNSDKRAWADNQLAEIRERLEI